MEKQKSSSLVDEFQEGLNSAMIVMGLSKKICQEADIPTTGSNLALASQLLMIFCGISNLKEISMEDNDSNDDNQSKTGLIL